MKHSSLARIVLAAAGALGLIAAAAGPATAATSPSSGLVYSVHPIIQRAHFSHVAALPQNPADCLAATGGEFACQTPDSIRAAYDIPATVNGDPAGTGQTIVILDAYGSPTVRSDLANFSAAFGLPAATLNVYYPVGMPTWTGSRTQVNWAEETSLDVQWAHAVAPGATIDLVVSATPYGDNLNAAEKWAVSHHLGNVMSMSFGIPENTIHGNNGQLAQAHSVYVSAAAQHMSVFASSGDAGSDNGAGFANFGFPASDPLVTAVGGTNLWVGSGLNEPRETVWGDFTNCPTTCGDGPFGATGGAPSLITSKGGSDVAYNASVYTGVLTYLGFLGAANDGFYFFGGTSAGSPQWAALTADVIQAVGHPVGGVNQYLTGWVANGQLNDVTVGSNDTPTFMGGFSATGGWDRPTGYGTPDVGAIITALSH